MLESVGAPSILTDELDERGPPEDQNSWGVWDTETTGIEKHDQAIEWTIDGPDSSWTQMFKPTVPIHCAARANHHITDEELADKPIFAEWLAKSSGFKPFGNARYLVAHNAEFDVEILKQTGLPAELFPEKVICTYKCARHLWPDAPSHKNQALRYHFDLKFTSDEKKTMSKLAAHRAPYDTIVTRALFRLMLQTHTLYQLERLTNTPFLIHVWPIGNKYRGVLCKDIRDRGFWQWVLDKGPLRIGPDGTSMGFDENMRHTARFYYNQSMA